MLISFPLAIHYKEKETNQNRLAVRVRDGKKEAENKKIRKYESKADKIFKEKNRSSEKG